MDKKIISLSEAKRTSSKLRSKKKRIVFTNGCFDLVHAGHIKYLQKAKALGEVLVVGVNSDSSMKRIKGPKRPIIKQNDRAKVVAALEAVDYVIIFYEKTPLKLIKAIKPDVLVKGADWRLDDIVGADFVRSYGGRITSIALLEGRSTSAIIRNVVRRFR